MAENDVIVDTDLMKGIMLAMEAQAEVLSKMNTRIEKQDEDEKKKREEEEMEMKMKKSADEKADLIESITKSILSELRKQQEQKVAPKINTVGEKAQDMIQGSEDSKVAKQEEDEEDEEDEKKKKNGEEEEYPEVEKLKKEIEELRKSQDKAVKMEVETRLRKAGWREENKLKTPQRTVNAELGADENNLIFKSEDTDQDKISKMAKMSWKNLTKMKLMSDSGQLSPEVQQLIG